jgi:hypothetical protein
MPHHAWDKYWCSPEQKGIFMVGLVFAESLALTTSQWTALALNMAGWLWCYRQTQHAGEPRQRSVSLTAVLTLSVLWIAFWNMPTSVDQHVLFEQARYLSRYAWPDFLDAFAHRPYVEYQPPFFTFWVSRWPVFWLHQLLLFPWGLLCVGLMWKLYRRKAALLCATPVFALMIHQPSTDTILFGCLLIVLRLKQCAPQRYHSTSHKTVLSRFRITLRTYVQRPTRYSALAALLYGLSWMVKPLTLLTMPFVLPQLGLAGIGSLALWGGYIWWSQRWEFGRHQFRFLLHQLFIKRMASSRLVASPPRPTKPVPWLTRAWWSGRWRWRNLGRESLQALPFYVCPTYLRAWTWKGIVLAGIIILGYGNSKYLLLNLLWVFPVSMSDE